MKKIKKVQILPWHLTMCEVRKYRNSPDILNLRYSLAKMLYENTKYRYSQMKKVQKESTDITLVTNEECFVMDMGIVMVFC
ncbi:MAG: hypothetical protein QF876_04060 [Desulfobacterales bacterium]|jgi:hypothetical protein|nr:hypothetical protein [Desulfobacter sp.]MDP6682145.1 hypothetical protein [Desulfobacterales bacterium]MDP6808921.1 hypothetical protein [Desulfobacterales bacterium]|tara:strand:+ start:132 stop:374 length:243 start_codon:yes stop_codon:yes gene_type:complete